MKKSLFSAIFLLMTLFSLPIFANFNQSTVNGDVIVRDSKTGLLWQKTYETGLTWKEALAYCEDLTYAGYSDWRMPNRNELVSLVNYNKYNPASDFPEMPTVFFWSSTTDVSSGNAIVFEFKRGDVRAYAKSSYTKIYVRCVR